METWRTIPWSTLVLAVAVETVLHCRLYIKRAAVAWTGTAPLLLGLPVRLRVSSIIKELLAVIAMACNPCTCLLWLLVLVFISGPVSCFCFFIYCFVGPLAGCCKGLEPLADMLIEGVKYPQTCAKNMCG